MFIDPAYAQAAGAAPGSASDLISTLVVPMGLMLVVFYFLLIRPQQKRAKAHQDMVKAIRRGDTIVTSGGFIGKVVKATDETELLVEIGENVQVRVLRAAVNEVRVKGEPVKAETAAKA